MPLLFPLTRRSSLLLLWLLLSPSHLTWADWKVPRENLDHRRVVGKIRIYYTQDGEHAFPVDTHTKQARLADGAVLDRLLAQFEQANRFYSDVLGLVPPLQNRRYLEVSSIDVHILNLGRGMGGAGDGIVRYRYRHFDAANPAITITLSNRWRPPNSTPNHELFHAYQYGYTYFKTSWFLEGLARSMDNAFANRAPAEPLPQNTDEIQEIMTRSYNANTFWNRVMQLCDPGCKTSAGKTNLPQLCGGSIVRPLLEQYQTLDGIAAKNRGIDPYNWPEAEQRSDKNNPYLLQGLRGVLESHCPLHSSPELRRFHQLLREQDTRSTPLY